MIGRTYLERGQPVVVVLRSDWKTGAPRNVLIRRADGELVVRPFRGLRKTQDTLAGVQRAITGFRQDDEGDWIADLACGHSVHLRHNPPWQVRPWITDAEQRQARLGTTLECAYCTRGD